MNIAPATLIAEAKSAIELWPWVTTVEDAHSLPRWLLLAVGSRETNLSAAFTQGKTGDGGHGHGVWQLDDRSHTIPAGFDTDARAQAEAAAALLQSLLSHYKGALVPALDAYNAGSGAVDQRLKQGENPDLASTGHDYGADVKARLEALQQELGGGGVVIDLDADRRLQAAVTEEVLGDMIASDPATGDYWVLTGGDGGIDVYNANGTKGDRFYGNLVDHPEYNAGAGTPNGPAVAISFWAGTGAGAGYVIFTRDTNGGVHPYRFDPSTVKAHV